MAAFLDACRFNAAAGGATDWTFSSTVQGYQSPSAAGALNGRSYRFRAESADLTQWEIATGAYASSTGTFARTTVLCNSSGTTAKISFAAAPQVAVLALAEDLDVSLYPAKQVPKAADQVGIYDVTGADRAVSTIAQIAAARPPRGHIWGLTLSNDGASPTTVLDIAAGEAASDATSPLLMVSSAMTKTCNVAWTAGGGNGALDAGSALAASTGYHVFQIMRSDTGAVDALISTSATAPTLPASYDHKRRIGWIRTDASAHILTFKQFEDFFYWGTATLDSSGAVSNNVEVTITLTVPTGVRVEPFINFDHLATTNNSGVRVRSPDLTTTTSLTNTSNGTYTTSWLLANGSSATRGVASTHRLLTNTSGQIAARTMTASNLEIVTEGWCDSRGRLS